MTRILPTDLPPEDDANPVPPPFPRTVHIPCETGVVSLPVVPLEESSSTATAPRPVSDEPPVSTAFVPATADERHAWRPLGATLMFSTGRMYLTSGLTNALVEQCVGVRYGFHGTVQRVGSLLPTRTPPVFLGSVAAHGGMEFYAVRITPQHPSVPDDDPRDRLPPDLTFSPSHPPSRLLSNELRALGYNNVFMTCHGVGDLVYDPRMPHRVHHAPD